MVHVDPEDGREQVGDVLPRVERVGRVRVPRIAGGDVKHTVGAEVEIPAVVTTLQEGDDDFLARRVDPRRVRPGDLEPRHARAVRQVRLAGIRAAQGIADEALAVLLEVRVEGQPVHGLNLLRPREPVNRLELPGQVQEKVGPSLGVVGEGIEDARLLADDQTLPSGIAGDEQGMVELQIRERTNDLEGRRRVGSARDAGGRPGRPARPGRLGLPGLPSLVRGRALPGPEGRREQDRQDRRAQATCHGERMTA